MRKAIAFTAAVAAAIPVAGAFVAPSALVGRVTLASAAPARSTGAPVLGASRLRLRNAAPAAGLRMAQTFTESETWQQTDIPALLKEAASQFFEGECTFEPCSGGVNNLVQYCQTSSGDKYVIRIYNNGGNTKRVKYEHAVLAALDPVRSSLSFEVPKYLGTLADPAQTFVKLSSGAEACVCKLIPGQLPKNADPYILGMAAGELVKAMSPLKVDVPCPTPPYYEVYDVHHAISKDKFYAEIQKPEFDCMRDGGACFHASLEARAHTHTHTHTHTFMSYHTYAAALPKLVAELERLDELILSEEAIKRNEGKYPETLVHGCCARPLWCLCGAVASRVRRVQRRWGISDDVYYHCWRLKLEGETEHLVCLRGVTNFAFLLVI